MVIEVVDLWKSYGRVTALRGVTFRVEKKVIAGLLGPNGSGKTTTLKILVGLLSRDRGKVSVMGYDPWFNEIEVKRLVGILHEKPVYPLNTTVLSLLKHLAKLRGYDEKEAKRVIKLVGLEKLQDFRVKALSRGYLQRLGLAQALLGDPEILLLDEPTANLDPLARREILNLISVLQRDLDITVVISSHIIPELQEVCNYAIFIKEGIVAGYGSLEELSKAYFVELIYEVEADKPRELAIELMKHDFVNGVDIRQGKLLVRVARGGSREFIATIEELTSRYGIRSCQYKSTDLGELYEKVITAK